MARPLQEMSVSDASATTTGSAVGIGGRMTAILFVVAKNADTADDTVEVDLEVSQDGSNWAKLRNEQGTQIGQISTTELADIDGNGDAAAMVKVHGIAVDELRANLKSFTDAANDDLSVTAYVGATDNSETSKGFRTVA